MLGPSLVWTLWGHRMRSPDIMIRHRWWKRRGKATVLAERQQFQ